MEVKEIKERRRKLAEEIRKMVEAFNKEAGVMVKQVDFNYQRTEYREGGRVIRESVPSLTDVGVTIDWES
jgi:uncharacterized FlaG/YvyC family protein